MRRQTLSLLQFAPIRLSARASSLRAAAALVAALVLAGCAGGAKPPTPPASLTPAASSEVAASNRQRAVRVRDVTEPQIGVEVGAHAAFVRRLDVSIPRGLVVTASDDKTARVWDLATGALRHVLRPAVGDGELGRLYGAAIHPTEPLVAVGGTMGVGKGSHRILVFSLETGQLVRAIDARGGHVKKLAWSADGTVLLAVYAGDHALRAFDVEGRPLYDQPLNGPAYGLAVARDGRVAASALDGSIVVVGAQGRRVVAVASYRAPRGEPVGLSFSPDGQRLAVAFFADQAPPMILDTTTGKLLATLAGHPIHVGRQFTVAWSADGRTLAASGSGYTAGQRFPIFFHDAASGRLIGQQDVGQDTIYDLVGLGEDRFAFASGDGTWGVVAPKELRLRIGSTRPDLKGPDHLRVSADGRIVGWMHAWGREPMTFELDKRIAAPARDGGTGGALTPPRTGGPFANAQWFNTGRPQIAGHAIALDASELSRALAALPDDRGAILGTSQRLMRIDRDGTIAWQQRDGNEVRAVNVSGDGRMVVSAMSDGTLRWWRAADGALLATLLAMRDGRWVVWTPEGYFDAGAGADRLVGWTVNRAEVPVADHFSLTRFRDRYSRPDLIDRVLRDASPIAALDRSIVEPQPVAGATAPATGRPTTLPPVVENVAPARVSADNQQLEIPVAVRAGAEVEVRVDGRPVDATTLATTTTQAATTSSAAQATVVAIPTPAPSSIVQVLARDKSGVSEPVGFVVEERAAASTPGAAPSGSAGPTSGAPGVTPSAPPGSTGTTALAVRPAAQTAEADSIQGTGAQVAFAPPTQAPSTGRASGTTGARVGQPGPRLHVLAVGISEYQRAEYRLGLAAKDARDFATAMKGQAGRYYRQVEVRTLTDGEATRMAVIANLKWLADSVGNGDIGMLFIAGHGLNTKTNQYYFLPWDGNHESLETTGLPEAAIRDTLARMRGRALFFVDTCFGGNAVGNFQTASRELARMANDLAASENGVIVFASSSGRQLSEEDDRWGNGAFTYALLAGLSGRADLTRSGRVTFKALDYYVSEEVNRLTNGRQTPVTISPIGVPDFAIARTGVI